MKWRRSKLTQPRASAPLNFSDWLAILGAAVLLILIAAYFALDAWAEHRLNAEITKIRAAGEPITLQDVSTDTETLGAGVQYAATFEQIQMIAPVEAARWRRRYDEEQSRLRQMLADFEERHHPLQNITPAIEAELAGLMQLIEEAGGLGLRDLPDQHLVSEWQDSEHKIAALSERAISEAGEMIEAYGEPLTQLRRAAEIDLFQLDRPVKLPQHDPLLPTAADAARLLTASALLHLRAERSEAAVQEIIALLRLRRVTQSPRTVRAHYLDGAITSNAAWLIAALLPRLPAGSPWFARLDQELEAASAPSLLTEALILERAKWFGHLQRVRDHDRSAIAYWDSMPDSMIRMEMADFLVEADRMVNASRRPLPQMMSSFQLDVARVTDPDFWKTLLYQEASAVATMMAVRTAIAVERFRHDHQRMPQSLEELTPVYLARVRIDPFTGRPMLFRASDDVYVIYSAGRNGINDYGAVTQKPPWSRYTPDDGVRVHLK